MKILLALVISFNAYGITTLKKGDKAPEDGYLFNSQEEKSLRQIERDKVVLQDLNILKDQKIDILNQRIENYRDQKQNMTWFKENSSTMYFLMGFLASSLSVYLATRYGE